MDINQQIVATGVKCLWDLNQLIGEMGLDKNLLQLTYKGETICSYGNLTARHIAQHWGDISPRSITFKVL